MKSIFCSMNRDKKGYLNYSKNKDEKKASKDSGIFMWPWSVQKIYSHHPKNTKKTINNCLTTVVVMPWTILPQRNRRCALSATNTRKPGEENDTRGVTCLMEVNKISLREVTRFDEQKRQSLKWKTAAGAAEYTDCISAEE